MAVSEITSEDIRGFIGHVLDTRADATARQRYSSLAVLFKWLLAEGEIEADPMSKVTRPKADPPRVEIVTDRQFKLLLDTCDTTFLGRRDEAILWIFYDTGMRVSELCGLSTDDVSLDLEVCWVDGKTGEREAPFTPSTTHAIDRYLRLRNKHKNSRLSNMWLSDRGRGVVLTKSGVYRLVSKRAKIAKIGHIHPHMFRHTAADRFLSAGMSEGSVMEVMGWTDRTMIDRYGKSVRRRRAIDDYRKLVG